MGAVRVAPGGGGVCGWLAARRGVRVARGAGVPRRRAVTASQFSCSSAARDAIGHRWKGSGEGGGRRGK